MVVVATTNILVGDAGAAWLDVERGGAIEAMLQDGRDVSVGERADTERACAGCVEAIRAVLQGETEHAKA